jgi:tetratricopeptide (TPR) repeat protein
VAACQHFRAEIGKKQAKRQNRPAATLPPRICVEKEAQTFRFDGLHFCRFVKGFWRHSASMTAMPRHRRQAILREASGYIELGELLVQQDTPVPPSGQKLLHRALDLLALLPEPTRSMAMAKLLEGEALRALGRFEEGLVALRLVTEQEPKRLEAWLGMGWCLKRLGRLEDAIGSLEQGLHASPREPILLYNLACYHSLAGRVQAAIEHLTKAISLDDRYRDLTGAEPDFDPIRQDPRFVAVTHVTV